MKQETDRLNPEFAEALREGHSSGESSRRQMERKARQLCRQVQHALNLALAGRGGGELPDGLFIDEVAPAPDCGRLVAYVLVPPGCGAGETVEALGRALPGLRSEVAAAISRKRAPELCFVPVCADGGHDDD